MRFPDWIDRLRGVHLRRARLKYMLRVAALARHGRTSMRDLAEDIGCNHSSISLAIKRGYFTEAMALKIEAVFGRATLPHEWLMNPTDINSLETST